MLKTSLVIKFGLLTSSLMTPLQPLSKAHHPSLKISEQLQTPLTPLAQASAPSTLASKAVQVHAPKPEKPVFEKLSLHTVLNDRRAKVSDEFEIPRGLYWRVSFWYNIYTKYDSRMKVIHHEKYPWVVYDVSDENPIYQEKGRYYNKVRKAWSHTFNKRKAVHTALRNLYAAKTYRGLKGMDLKIYRLLKQIPGSRKKVIKEAMSSLRIQTGQKNYFQSGLENGNRYLSALENMFKDEGLPPELTRLPLVESSFNRRAVSKVGASGIWQIMPYIGSRFMNVNEQVDERNSPLKAARVAAMLLKENYQILGKDWSFAVTAYNHGPGGLKRAASKTKDGTLAQVILNYKNPKFGFASENFYSEFLAALYAEKYKSHIYKDLKLKPAMRYDIYQLTNNVEISAETLLELSGLSRDEMIDYNYDLKHILKLGKKVRAQKKSQLGLAPREVAQSDRTYD